MWRHYLKAGWASLARSKAYSLINLIGLSLGLAASLIILGYVRYELSYDIGCRGGPCLRAAAMGAAVGRSQRDSRRRSDDLLRLGERLRQFPQLDRIVYVGNAQPVILQNGEASTSEDFVFVNGPCSTYSSSTSAGRPCQRARQPGSLVLTESEAIRRFRHPRHRGPDAHPRDRRRADRLSRHRRRPGRSTQQPSRALDRRAARFRPLYGADSPFLNQWMPKNGWVYARLRPGADVDEIARQMPAWERRNIPDQLLGGERQNPGTDMRLAAGQYSRRPSRTGGRRRHAPGQ
jgi:putative ABC transport system permease protein